MAAVRVLLIVFWLSAPAIFLFLYLRGQRARLSLRGGSARSWFAASSVAINWILFVVLLVRSLMSEPDGTFFPTSILTHIFLAVSCVGVVLGARKWPLLMANLALVTLWIVFAYAPAHWLRHWGAGAVRLNGQRADATLYLGDPYASEAEEIALVDIPGVGDYFLSFGEEKVRLAPTYELIHLPGGIWDFKSLRQMGFIEQLQSKQSNEMGFVEQLQPKESNEFRFAAPDGRVIEVQF